MNSLKYACGLAAVMTLGMGVAQAASEPACDPIIQSFFARSKAPAESSTMLVKALDATIETIYVNGKTYARISAGKRPGTWQVALEDRTTAVKTMATQMKNGEIKLSACKVISESNVDGIPTTMIGFNIQSPGSSKVGAGTIQIGKSDQLPYEFIAMGNNLRSRYTNVKAPKVKG